MDLNKLSQVNLARCTSPEGFNHQLESWSEAEWANAIAGEFGELLEIICLMGAAVGKASNLTKKLLRHRDQVVGNVKAEDMSIMHLKLRSAEEIADMMIYADLAIQRLGFGTSDVLKRVFNDKSDQLGCLIKYEED